MNTILKWSICCILVSFLGCKKEKKLQSSTWTVNNETFTDVANVSIGKAIAILGSHDNKNRFSITFYLSYPEHLPREGSWPISAGSGQNPSYAYIVFHYNSQVYIVSPNEISYIEASTIDGKASYKLDSTWYINYKDSNDSILIQGTFNEPKI